MGVSDLDPDAHGRLPWNSGNMVGAKRPLKPRDVWAIRFFLDEHRRLRDRALFDPAIDSKLRGCDIVKMKIGDIVAGGALRLQPPARDLGNGLADIGLGMVQHPVLRIFTGNGCNAIAATMRRSESDTL